MDKLNEILNFLEGSIDEDNIARAVDKTKRCLNYDYIEEPVLYSRKTRYNFDAYAYSDIAADMGKMLYNELLGCVASITNKTCGLPMVRANYGVGTLSSLFGAESVIVGNNLPWVRHFKDINHLRKIAATGIPSLEAGFGKRVIETYEYYSDVLEKYPKCSQVIKLYHPDLQGPFDTLHLMAGSDIYLLMYDEPDLIHDLMSIITDTYIEFMKKIKKYINDDEDGFCYHWHTLYKGSIVLRNDSAVNLSAQQYKEFLQKYDEKILCEFGGGSVHYCGRADQLVFNMLQLKGMQGINFGYMENAEFGQKLIDKIYPEYREKKIPVISYFLTETELKDFDFDKYNTGISFICNC